MKRGFIFMLDAFIALLVVLAFVSTLSSYTRDYSYVQDEALYSQGRNIMDILLYTTIETEERGEIPLIHALRLSEGKSFWNEKVKPLIPENINYTIEYYDVSSSGWISFGSAYDTLKADEEYYIKSISVISSIPIITRNEQYKAPYTYPDSGENLCAVSVLYEEEDEDEGEEGEETGRTEVYEHVCGLWDTVYFPDEFNGDPSLDHDNLQIGNMESGWELTENYGAGFVRVVVKV